MAHDRRHYRQEEAAGRRSATQVAPAPAEHALLALQQSAGNTQTAALARTLEAGLAQGAAVDEGALLESARLRELTSADREEPLAARAPGGGARLARFVESEHKSLGDVGSGGAEYERKGLALTHGDIVMLTGDHFSEAELFWLWDNPSDRPGKREGTQDEIIYALKWQLGDTDTRFLYGGKWHFIKFSDDVEKRVKSRYFELARENVGHFADPGRAGFGVGGFPPESAGATYHETHERAIMKAYRAGARGEDVSMAMALEAAGQHFLTDAFAAGHLSTQRGRIVDVWNSRYPRFGEQFVDKVARDMAVKLNDQASGLSGALTINQFEEGARDTVMEKLAGKGLPKLGDILAVTVHAYDNEYGLWVTNDLGWTWAAWGDSKLDVEGDAEQEAAGQHTNRSVATQAVQLGIADITTAYGMGQRDAGSPLPDLQVFDQVRQRPEPPAEPGDKYGPEQLMPRIDVKVDQGKLGWEVDSIEALWDTRVRSTSPITFGDYITRDMQPGGTMGGELEEIRNSIDEEMNPFPWYSHILAPILIGHGYVYPRRAFTEAVIEPVRDRKRCMKFLVEVVSQ